MARDKSDTYRGDYAEAYRPQFHFTPAEGWMNDPNGLLYYDGEYHLFYQYLPGSINHAGPMHWGHAVSSDLVHWQHLPIALFPDRLEAIWSGSAVVDWRNSGGFQVGDEKALVAIFTHNGEGKQQQSIAYSHDRGRSWMMYAGNPVLPNPGIQDFRDPKVFWHQASSRWVMVLAAGDRVKIYTSPDLKAWTFASDFGEGQGTHGGVWECPDLFELAVDGNPDNEQWVMLVSVGDGSPNGGSGTQYFIGRFDGTTFTNSYPATAVHWVDYGRDNYAGVTFSDIPEEDGRRLFLAWMNNWQYAHKIPTSPWRGAMTIPRELVLTATHFGESRLISRPVTELQQLRGKRISMQDKRLSDSTDFRVRGSHTSSGFEMILEFELGTASELGVVLHNEQNERTIIGYDTIVAKLFVNRINSGIIDFDPGFGQHIHSAPLSSEKNMVWLQLFVDRTLLEVFANGGSVLITELFFPHSKMNEIEFYATGGRARIVNCDIWQLGSIWKV